MTEKDYNPERRNKKILDSVKLNAGKNLPRENVKVEKKEIDDDNLKVTSKERTEQDKETEENNPEEKKTETSDEKIEEKTDKPEEKKKPNQKKPIVKKTEAIVNGVSLPISGKTSYNICRFIKYKKIQDVVADLEKVIAKKKAVPMKGEIPHRKGKIMAGRFPKKSSEYFVKMLKELSANAIANGLENPIISEAIANKASEPYGRFGRVQKKRTHVKIVAREKVSKSKNSEEKK